MLVAVCGTVPLLPALAIYQGLFAIVVDADIQGGLAALVEASAVGRRPPTEVHVGSYRRARAPDPAEPTAAFDVSHATLQ